MYEECIAEVGSYFCEAKRAIQEADLVVLGPGDLYTSLVANLAVKGVPETIQKSKAKTGTATGSCLISRLIPSPKLTLS